MIIKKDIKIKILATILFLAALAIIILPAYFNRNKSYGCTIQFVDTDKDTVLMSFEATCHDDDETDRHPYYTHRVYSIEAYSNKQQYDIPYDTNLWNAERDAWRQADINNSLHKR